MKGILGIKLGMTQVFTVRGKLIPVTAVAVSPNVVTQIKTREKDGYEAVQLGFLTKREKLANKPELGHFKKTNTLPKRFLREIRDVDLDLYQLGKKIKVDIFEVGEIVDVTGISKGKGFQGVIKRYNQKRGPMTHGSRHHRRVGSLGSVGQMNVSKGKKLPGHMGNETVTIQNLKIVAIDTVNNLILIKGSVPGPSKSLVIVKTSIKKPKLKIKTEELVSYQTVVDEHLIKDKETEDSTIQAPKEIESDVLTVDNESKVKEVKETEIIKETKAESLTVTDEKKIVEGTEEPKAI